MLPVWDEICGSCGARQSAVVEQYRQAAAARQAEAEGLLGDLEFERALAVASQIKRGTHPRLPNLSDWVQAFTHKAEEAREHQAARAAESIRESAQHEAAHDYLSAIFVLESVPESMRSVQLPEAKESVSIAIARLKKIQSEVRRLDAAIRQKMAAKLFDALLPDVESLLAFEPNRRDMQKLRMQLLERCEKQRRARDEAVKEAKSLIQMHEYERAAAILADVAPAMVTKQVAGLREMTLERMAEIKALGTHIQHAVTAKRFDGLLQKVERYLRHKPQDEAACKLRQSLVAREDKIASEITVRLEKSRELRQQCRFQEAIALLEVIPVERSSDAVQKALASCLNLAQIRLSAFACLRQAERGEYARAVRRAEQYEQLLATEELVDQEFAAALLKARTDADIDRHLARAIGVYVPTAAALVAVALLVTGGLWLRTSMRDEALQAGLARRDWDAVLRIDPNNAAGLIGRASKWLAASPPTVSLSDFRTAVARAEQDLAKAEAMSENAEDLAAAKALLSMAHAEFALQEGRLEDAVMHIDSAASKFGASSDAISKWRVRLHGAGWIGDFVAVSGGENLKRNSPPSATDPPRTVTNSIGMKFVSIPAGEFLMGSAFGSPIGDPEEEFQHHVRITSPFFIGMHEVTQAQYEEVMGDNPSVFKGKSLPVDHVSWQDARRFCQRLSAMAVEQQAGRHYRLPTEAEWEYACRAGTTSVFNTGDTLTPKQAQFCQDRQYEPCQTTPIGSFLPNAWGLYDMHGNVWEWTADWFSADYYRQSPVNDPGGPPSGTHHTLRGGSASVQANECYSAIRGEAAASDGPNPSDNALFAFIGDFGLRVVLTSSR